MHQMPEFPLAARIAAVMGFMALLMVASIVPGRAQASDPLFVRMFVKIPKALQKMLHVGVYGLFTLLLVWMLADIQPTSLRLALAVSIAVAFGAAMEWYQTGVPGRFGTIYDVALDASGAMLGVFVAVFLL